MPVDGHRFVLTVANVSWNPQTRTLTIGGSENYTYESQSLLIIPRVIQFAPPLAKLTSFNNLSLHLFCEYRDRALGDTGLRDKGILVLFAALNCELHADEV